MDQLKYIFDNANVGIAICDAFTNRLEIVNPAFATIHGYETDELIGHSPDEIFIPEYMQKLMDESAPSCAHNDLFFETTHIRKDGSLVEVSVHVTLIKNDHGIVQQRIINIIDITERKRAEQQLQEMIEFNQEIMNTIPDLLFELDKEGNYLNIWAQDESLLATQREMLLGKNIRDVLLLQASEVCFQTMQEVDEKGQSFGNILYIDLPNGRKWFELSASKRKSSGSYILLSRDITVRKQHEEHLQKTKAKLSAVISTMPDLIWVKDINGVYLMCNLAFERFFGAPTSEIIGKTDHDFLDASEADTCRFSDIQAYKKGEMIISEELITYKSDGEKGILEIRKASVYDSHGNFMGILGIGRDITKRKQMEMELQRQKDFQSTLLDSIAKAGLGVHVIENGRYIYTNDMHNAKKYGYHQPISELQPHFLDTIHDDDKERAWDMYTRRLRGEDVPSTYELNVITADGTSKEHSVSVIVIPNSNPIRTIVVTQDISEQKAAEKKMHFLAHHDPLIGLPNRISAKRYIEQAIEKSRLKGVHIALFYIDLDEFKTINDTLGHSIGDKILKNVATRIIETIDENHILCRQGGDEFLLVIDELNHKNEAEILAKRVIQSLDKAFSIDGHVLNTSASIGIALYPDHGHSHETLLKNADMAMYQAKNNGKNSYSFYDQKLNHHIIGQFKLQNDLKSALLNNEFVLHYQPQIDIEKNYISGTEALLRWNHPQLGMIPPMSFIPVAESSGLIVQIGQWVIEEACRQAMRWYTKGIPLTVAVNISAIQFKHGNLEDIVKSALLETSLPPFLLELELTESVMMHNVEKTLQAVQSLKALGVQLSIDDFGTGYSSLAYLKRFAVNKLKIDQSFIRDILNNQEDAVIVQTIIQMAKNLNLTTIAEGVETQEVLNLINYYGCDEVQGYHFSKPLDVSEFETYYNEFDVSSESYANGVV